MLSRNWLQKLRLNWQIRQIQWMPALQETLLRHGEVLEDKLWEIKGKEARINMDPQAQPYFYKARLVPFALRDKVEAELECLQKEGIIEPVH